MNLRCPCAVWACCLLFSVNGCASLDPTEDLDRAARLVEDRNGRVVEWTSPPRPLDPELSLSDAIQWALATHPAVRAELESVAAARADFSAAHLLPNPVLALSYGLPTDGMGGTPLMGSVTTQLSALWKRPAKIDAAAADLRAAVLSASATAIRLTADVRSRYAAAVHADLQHDLERRRVEHLSKRLELVTALFDAGEGDRRSVNAAEFDLARAHDRALRAEEVRLLARRQLAERLALPKSDGEQLVLDPAGLPDPDTVVDESAVFELVALQRLDVVAALTAVDRASAAERLAALEQLPGVDVGLSFQENFSGREGLFPSLQLIPDLFGSGRTARAKAQAIERRSLAVARQLLLRAVLETRVAHTRLKAAQRRRQNLARRSLRAARENVTLSEEAFAVGATTRDQLLLDRARLLEIERDLDADRLAARLALIELEHAAGGTLRRLVLPNELRPTALTDRSHSSTGGLR